MGAWGDQPLENDSAWDIIGSITDTVIQTIAAALEAGEALRARHALWLLGQMDARLPAVVMPEREIITEWRARLFALTTAPATLADATTPLAVMVISQELTGFVEEGLARQSDLEVLGALGALALLIPDVEGLSLPPAATLDDWERRFWEIDLSGWNDPDARAQAARETFAAIRERRLPMTTHTGLMERIAEELDNLPPDDLFGGLLNDGLV
jgi:hypothetical protein